MSSGENFRLAIATRGFRGGGLGTRYVDEQITLDSIENIVTVNIDQDNYSVVAALPEAINASIEIQTFTADIYEID
jgi:hypothetical protein